MGVKVIRIECQLCLKEKATEGVVNATTANVRLAPTELTSTAKELKRQAAALRADKGTWTSALGHAVTRFKGRSGMCAWNNDMQVLRGDGRKDESSK